MTTSPVTDLCRATERRKGQLLICQRPLNHPGLHDDDLGHVWQQDPPPNYGNERTFTL